MSTSESASKKRTFTTHDAVFTESVTIEHPLNKVGDTQIYAGHTFVFTGDKWIPLEGDASAF